MNFSHLFRVAIWALILLTNVPAHADETRRDKLGKLMDAAPLPAFMEVMDLVRQDLRTHFPHLATRALIRDKSLARDWRPGQAQYDRTVEILSQALTENESRHGPLFALSKERFLDHFDPTWASEDIDFIVGFLATDNGRKYLSAIDNYATAELTESIAKDSAEILSQDARNSLVILRDKARRAFAALYSDLNIMRIEDPETTRRIEQLSAGFSEKAGRLVGAQMMKPSVERILLISFDVRSQIAPPIEQYRREVADRKNI